MRLKNLDLLVTMSIAVMNLVWALLPSHITVIGIIIALPLIFMLPGYTLTEVLFHKRSLDASHRLLLSLGLSLAIDVLSGLILNMLPIGLQAISWAVLLGLLTVVFSLLVAFLRRGALWNMARPPRFRLTIYEGILFGLAILVAILSLVYTTIGAERQQYPGFTQLWMLPEVQAGTSCAVRLGVHSFESTSVTYRITLTMNGTQVTTWPAVTLAPQEEWDRLVSITPEVTDNLYVQAELYRLDRPQAMYREVHLTLSNLGKSKDGKMRLCGT
jgi:uncharacterized membrane protein